MYELSSLRFKRIQLDEWRSCIILTSSVDNEIAGNTKRPEKMNFFDVQ